MDPLRRAGWLLDLVDSVHHLADGLLAAGAVFGLRTRLVPVLRRLADRLLWRARLALWDPQLPHLVDGRERPLDPELLALLQRAGMVELDAGTGRWYTVWVRRRGHWVAKPKEPLWK